jgi:transcriptional regulator with GAF, ATPase, and Fis domain
MPILRTIASPSGVAPRTYRIYKAVTSLGRGEENDVALADAAVRDAHAQIRYDGRDFVIVGIDDGAELTANGKRKSRHRLVDNDVLRIGDTEMVFSVFDLFDGAAVQDNGESSKILEQIGAYRKLFEFSERLLGNYDLDDLLERLMDAVITITRGDKGFLLLVEGDDLAVKVARNLRRENLADARGQLSDSIVEKVIKTRKPVIVSDALHDAEFQNAMSVMSLRLSSVMCVPLGERGNLLGAIYVGNDSIRHLFDEGNLEVLTIFAAQASLILRNALLVNELKVDNRMLAEKLEKARFGEIIGACAPMQEVYRKVTRLATTDVSVLITGETGTGKELIAREIHRRSNRAKGPFITINCGAIPENLLESELFGHVKGAFTGAVANKPGRFQAADRGTLFLDEIGEMPPPLQVKILRALQERVVTRVGDHRPESVDIRVIAATNREPEAEIKAGRFREDLYYRLNVVNLHLPPLRERGDDVLVIAKYLLGRFADEYKSAVKGLSPEALGAIRKFSWPGNIRQLENHLKKAVVLADKALLGADDLGLADVEQSILPLAEAKERFQRDYINEVLARNNGNRTKTARDLDVDPRTIFRHLEKEGDEGGEPL